MTKRRWFMDGSKARATLSALTEEKTLQEITAKHQVHPNRMSTSKRRAMDGRSEVFACGEDRGDGGHEVKIHRLHAKFGKLTVEQHPLSKGPQALS